ncbi:MAG: hypothetical protein IIX01_06200 [Clostridia bacterium]|nr:hypothetical protein [Clostridia bacterium]
MRDKMKKWTSLIAGVLACGVMGSLVGCSSSSYSPKKLTGNVAGEAVSNGGFAVEKGDYIYFINGSEDYTASNKLGSVKKGALMRIAKDDLSSGKYEEAQTVVPALFVSQNFNSGIYIYGDYVYFATPSTEKNKDGSVSNSYLNFKRAKIDGSSTEKELKEYFFRLDDNATQYRFVQGTDGTVYCMYADESTLYAYNVTTAKKSVLVSGATSSFYFDETDLASPYVYYTMSVTEGLGNDVQYQEKYNQIYCVSPFDKATVDEKNASYTVSAGYTYSIKDTDESFNKGDYADYPYVNLGELVYDGKGYSTDCPTTQYNHDDSTPATPNGYVYTLQAHRDGGVYFTRTDVNTSSSDGADTSLYYYKKDASVTDWKSIAANAVLANSKVALSTATATTSAVYKIIDGKHVYMYVSENKIVKVTSASDGSEESKFVLVPSATSPTLLSADDTYLYYYSSTSADEKLTANGGFIYRVNYTGSAADYSGLATTDNYKPLQIVDIDFNTSWYKPETFDNVLLYSSAQSFGGVAYNYINAINLQGSGANGEMTYEELKAFNDKFAQVKEDIGEFTTEYARLNKALEYYFSTGETVAFDEFIAEAKEKGYKDHYRYSQYEIDEFTAFTAHTGDYADKYKDENGKYYDNQDYFYSTIGVMKSADAKEIDKVWRTADYIEPLPTEAETENNANKTVWIVIAITVGVLAVATAVIVPIVISNKKKAKLLADREATKVRSRKKIDTTDDKSINVYETEEDTATEEPVEESVEESVETTEEEKTEE